MGSKICMNGYCRTTASSEWKKGWTLKHQGKDSNTAATLCNGCGSTYANAAFCETFHQDEEVWGKCRLCEKRIHLTCVASTGSYEHMNIGGVACISCARSVESRLLGSLQILGDEIPNGVLTEEFDPTTDRRFDKGRLMQMSDSVDVSGAGHLLVSLNDDSNVSLNNMKGDKTTQVNTCFTNFSQPSVGSSLYVKSDHSVSRLKQGMKHMFESLAQPSLHFSLGTHLITPSTALPFSGGGVEGSELNKASPSQQRVQPMLSKPPKPSPITGSEVNKGMASQTRIARPPAEGRGRTQLLPRYWPRITDQELQQISGDLKSTIVPLFEKVLSASDAGRIGRLVLPKACAEAYFPSINQSEGLPIKIEDVKGKEWTFQFRFWPNNNSRMYVLEGVTPCIQNMQLQAGDTVIFSRKDPGGQLVIGFRKATNNVEIQDAQTPVLVNGGSSGETSVSGASDNIIANGGQRSEDSLQMNNLNPEKKKARNIGSKNKRLLMHSDDAMELRITWEEAQELLRPPPTAKPTIVMIEDYEFEEYEEPPIFGKRTVFTAHPSGEQEQWGQCDSCSKWRRLPVHVLLPAKWSCSDNIWDLTRCSCFTPDETSSRELEAFNKASKDFKRRRVAENKVAEDCEPSGLDALATAAVLGDKITELAEPSAGATTKHPRHRPGCTCIVCIQPPSGKGKHPPSCKCNVCLTVRRRFKTLMLRKKKRQSEKEAELAQGKDQVIQVPSRDMSEIEGTGGDALLHMNHHRDNKRVENGNEMDVGESSKGQQLDLNCHPSREDDMLAEAAAGLNMTTLINAASLPLEMYLKQNGLGNLTRCLLSQPEIDESPPDEVDDDGSEKKDDDE